MKIKRLELNEFKRFANGLVLDDLADGLNIFSGPNEAGKSTVATALRAAFLERYKTTKVSSFAPEGLAQARPGVRVEFDIAGQAYVLSKTFLHRARCELLIGERRLEGEQAEDALASLLGFEFPQKGQSKPAHAGVPGLLWITQGTSQDVTEPATHAASHLRSALTQLTGALAATDGDKLYERVQSERAQLLDARHAKPKGAYREAEDALALAVQGLAEETARQATWEADVDTFAGLRLAHDRELAEPPWIPMEARATEARTRLAALAREAEAVERAEAETAQAQATANLLAEHVARDQADLADIQKLAAQRDQAHEQVELAERTVDRAKTALDALDEKRREISAALDHAREAEAYRNMAERQAAAQTEAAALQTRLTQAQAALAQVERLKAEHGAWHYVQADLTALREGSLRAITLQAKVDAVATRLHYTLEPGQRIEIDGQVVEGSGSRLVVDPVDVAIAGVGRLGIAPAGDDAAHVAQQLAAVRADIVACCERLGVASLEAAEARVHSHERIASELAFAQKSQAMHAPEGIAALAQHADEQRSTLQALTSALQAQPARTDPASERSLTACQQEADLIHADASRARDAWRDASAKRDTARAQAHWLSEQLTHRTSGNQAEQDDRDRAARRERLLDARARADVLARQAQQARMVFAAQKPELIEQDAQRFERSARLARDAHQARLAHIQQLKGKLEQVGAQGLGEALGEKRAEVERLTRRRDDVALRAQALTLLYERLGAQREAVTRRLFAPLATRLNHYLNLLFPAASIRIGDDLSPQSLARGSAAASLASLSFGTQEQLGVLTRLAYADVLRDAGKPTLIVLDDALVHTDDKRREQMKRALFDAATRHQILMLTCHGEAWRDMGVSLREL